MDSEGPLDTRQQLEHALLVEVAHLEQLTSFPGGTLALQEARATAQHSIGQAEQACMHTPCSSMRKGHAPVTRMWYNR